MIETILSRAGTVTLEDLLDSSTNKLVNVLELYRFGMIYWAR